MKTFLKKCDKKLQSVLGLREREREREREKERVRVRETEAEIEIERERERELSVIKFYYQKPQRSRSLKNIAACTITASNLKFKNPWVL